MAAGNFTAVKATDISSFKFGTTDFASSDFTSTDTALNTSFDTNNATPIVDLIGDRDSNNPVESDAFVKEISFGGNERQTNEENLLGSTSTGSQNKIVIGSTVSAMTVSLTCVYRNNVPSLLFSDATKCALMSVDTNEASDTGKMNFAFKNITVTNVGGLKQNSDGTMEQTISFSLAAGTNDGSAIAVTQTSPAETWSKVVMGNYAEEIRTA